MPTLTKPGSRDSAVEEAAVESARPGCWMCSRKMGQHQHKARPSRVPTHLTIARGSF